MGNVFRTTHLNRTNFNLDFMIYYSLCEFSQNFLQILSFGLLVILFALQKKNNFLLKK